MSHENTLSNLGSKTESCESLYLMKAHGRYDVVAITTRRRHPIKPGLRLCTDLNPAHGVSEVCDGENLWQ